MKKIFLTIIIVFLLGNAAFASYPNFTMTLEGLIGYMNYKNFTLYPKFLESIMKKENYNENKEICQTIFNEKNDKLIIGCSPVTFMGLYAKDLAESFKYDLVGFGGTTDEEMLLWLRSIDKKYNKIVLWGAANDIFIAMNKYQFLLDKTYFDTLDSLIVEARAHLKDSPMSELVYLKVKNATVEDAYSVDRMIRFNLMAQQVNDYVSKKGDLTLVDVTPNTTKENSDWFLHYNNRNAFLTILNDIEFADK